MKAAVQIYTTYSILSGVMEPSIWIDSAVDKGYEAIAFAEKQSMAGLIESQKECVSKGIKPILGCEFLVVSNSRLKQEQDMFHILLYAKDAQGYENLIRLNNFSARPAFIKKVDGVFVKPTDKVLKSLPYLRSGGKYFRKRIDLKVLREHYKGLVCVMVCNAHLSKANHLDMVEGIKDIFSLRDIYFGVNYSYEGVDVEYVQTGSAKTQEEYGAALATNEKSFSVELHAFWNELSLKHKFIPVQDAHCPEKKYEHLCQVVRKVDDTKKNKNCEDRFVLDGFLKHSKDFDKKDFNVKDFVSKFNYEIPLGVYHMPVVEPESDNPDRDQAMTEDLLKLALKFFKSRVCSTCDLDSIDSFEDLRPWGHLISDEIVNRGETLGETVFSEWEKVRDSSSKEVSYLREAIPVDTIRPIDEYIDRLQEEFDLVTGKNFNAYFHIVCFIYSYVWEIKGEAGPARGSAGGSVLAYLFGITKVDPIRHNLLFSRFLSESRKDLPDIDMDFDSETRDKIIDMLKVHFGLEQVIKIGTSSRWKVVSAIKDIARAYSYGIPDNKGNIKIYSNKKLTMEIKDDRITATSRGQKELDERIESKRSFKAFYKRHSKWFEEVVMPLQETISGTGIHAAGILILPEHVDSLLPVNYHSDGTIVTQYKDRHCEERGFPKFDFLVIEACDVVKRCRELIDSIYGESIPDYNEVSFLDRPTRKAFYLVQTEGVFQSGTGTQKKIFKRMGATKFEDVPVVSAVGRPGTMNLDLHLEVADRKRGIKPVEVVHEDLLKVTKDTHGLMIYQEQMMQISQLIAGFSPEESEQLRKVCGKKLVDKMPLYEDMFVSGGIEKGYSPEMMANLWETVAYFAEYSFNRSHSVAYALISWLEVWVKCRYPEIFWSSCMEYSKADLKKTNSVYATREYAEADGFSFKFPNYNDFKNYFLPLGDDVISWPLKRIKGIGKAAQVIYDSCDGSFDTVQDFFKKVEGRSCNKKVVVALIKSGFFKDCLGQGIHPREEALYVWEEFCRLKGRSDSIPDELRSDKIYHWELMKDESYNMQFDSWKYRAPFHSRIQTYYSDEEVLELEDNDNIFVGGQIIELEFKEGKKGSWAKCLVKDLGEFYRVYLWSDYWQDEKLDNEDIRPMKGDIVQIFGKKGSWDIPDSDKVIPQVMVDRTSKVDIIWRKF